MTNVALINRPARGADRWTDRLVRDFFGPTRDSAPTGHSGLTRVSGPPEWPAGGFNPAAEILKEDDDAVIRLELAGVDPEEDVTVEFDQDRLVISGERRDEHSTGDAAENGRTLREVRYGSFRRSFTLPAHVTGEAISASYQAGVLSVRVAGAYAGSQAQRIAIECK